MTENKNSKMGWTVANEDKRALRDRRKAIFIAALEEHGTVRNACVVASIPRDTFKKWHAYDLEFADRVADAKQSFGEALEEMAIERVKNPDKGRGSDMMMTVLLNAHLPQKYRQQTIVAEDTAKDVIAELRQLQKQATNEAKAGSGKSAEEGSRGADEVLAEVQKKMEARGKLPEKEESGNDEE